MAVVKVIDRKYNCNDSIKNLVRYATDINKTQNYIGAIGVNSHLPEMMIQQMETVKKMFDKKEGYRQARHIVVSFEDKAGVTPDMAYFMAYDIARYYSDKYQICFGVHHNTDNIHIHFVQNTVCFVDGKLFSGAFDELARFKRYVDNVENAYMKNTVNNCSREEFFGEETFAIGF